MLPVRCYTCNRCLSDKEAVYRKLVAILLEEETQNMGKQRTNAHTTFREQLINVENVSTIEKIIDTRAKFRGPRGKILDALNVHSMCCRGAFLSMSEK